MALFWTSRSSAKAFRVQIAYGPFWLTVRRTRTYDGALDVARALDHEGHYRITGPQGYRHDWHIPEDYHNGAGG